MGYKKSVVINHSLEKVFKSFIDLNKIEMPKFNKKNPTDTEYKRIIKQVGSKKVEMITKITKYEKDKIYEVTNIVDKDVYVSTFNFEKIDDNSCKLTLIEEQYIGKLAKILITIFKSISSKRKLKKKLEKISLMIDEDIKRKYKSNIA